MAGDLAKLLVIETSGPVGRVGLAVGPAMVTERALDSTRRHARDLAPTIADLLRDKGWRPRELNAVVVSLGPGSYTGLRVGIMTPKALAFATNCTILGIPTFFAIARQATITGHNLEVIADARQGKLYVQTFSRAAADRPMTPAGDLRIVAAAAWAQDRDPALAVTGPGMPAAHRLLPTSTPVVPSELWEPTLTSLLQVGWERFVRGDGDAALALEPIYLRPSSAEEQWQRLGR